MGSGDVGLSSCFSTGWLRAGAIRSRCAYDAAHRLPTALCSWRFTDLSGSVVCVGSRRDCLCVWLLVPGIAASSVVGRRASWCIGQLAKQSEVLCLLPTGEPAPLCGAVVDALLHWMEPGGDLAVQCTAAASLRKIVTSCQTTRFQQLLMQTIGAFSSFCFSTRVRLTLKPVSNCRLGKPG